MIRALADDVGRFTDILVHVDRVPHLEATLRFAVRLAKAQGARLVGLHVMVPSPVPGDVPDFLGSRAARALLDARRDRAADLQAVFAEITDGDGVLAEWRCVQGSDPVDQIARNARCCDLAVVGQWDPDSRCGDGDIAERVVMAAGRPVIVVPRSGEYPAEVERILVAWDASHPAARAVHDAMPLLFGARRVTVLAVDSDAPPADPGDNAGIDICHHLVCHGINAHDVRAWSDGLDVSARLLASARDENAGLMVMGAYGHSRLWEAVVGGVTRDVLARTTLPVLMSH